MRRHEFGFETGPLEEWLDDVVVASRQLLGRAADRVDRLVEDVLRDASEVARNASDLLDDFLGSLDERNHGGRRDDDRSDDPAAGSPRSTQQRGTCPD
jgi:hypothetical protein